MTQSTEQGTVTAVAEVTFGSHLVADVAAGATVLVLNEALDFNEGGGQLVFGAGGAPLDYVSADHDANEVLLVQPLAEAQAADAEVLLYPRTVERRAYVRLGDDDGEEAIDARVPHGLFDRLPEGTRDAAGERVTIDLDLADEWVVVDVLGKEPVIDGSYIDPDTIPPPALTDGEPPEASPTPTVLGGVGVLHVRWNALSNPDPVTYEVHLSTEDEFATSPATLVAETDATSITLRALPDGTALAYGPEDTPVVYFVRLVAKDADPGTAPPSEQDSGSLYRVGNAEISAEYGYFGSVNAAQITTGLMDAAVTVSGQVKTGDTGQRVVMDTQGLHLYDSEQRPVVDLPTDPSKLATFVGDAEMGQLSVATLNIDGPSGVGTSAGLELAQGINAPAVPPGVVLDHEVGATLYTLPRPFGGTSGDSNLYTRGLAYHGDHAWLVSQLGGSAELLCRAPRDGGVADLSIDRIADHRSLGVAVDPSNGDVWWLLRRLSDMRVVVRKYTVTTGVQGTVLAYTGVERDTTIGGDVWFLGFSIVGTDFHFGCIRVSDNLFALVTMPLASGGYTSYLSMNPTVTSPTGLQLTGFQSGTFDLGVQRHIFNINGVARVFTINGTTLAEVPGESWEFGYDGDVGGTDTFAWCPATSEFRQVQTVVPWQGHQWKKFTGIRWTTESSKWWAGYTWRNSVAGYSTNLGNKSPFTMKPRYRLRLSTPPIPGAGGASDPDAVSLYVGRSAAEPALADMHVQPANPALPAGQTALDLTTLTWTSTAPPATNTFPNSIPAYLRSNAKRLDGAPKTSLLGTGVGNVDGLLPPGSIQMYAGATAPAGWVLCDGSALNTATAPDLFAAIGYTFGGSGTSFNVPNMKDRQPMGVSTVKPLGEQAGSGSHTHTLSDAAQAQISYNGGSLGVRDVATAAYTETNRTVLAAGSAGSRGRGAALRGSTDTANHIPPYLAVNFIIKL